MAFLLNLEVLVNLVHQTVILSVQEHVNVLLVVQEQNLMELKMVVNLVKLDPIHQTPDDVNYVQQGLFPLQLALLNVYFVDVVEKPMPLELNVNCVELDSFLKKADNVNDVQHWNSLRI